MARGKIVRLVMERGFGFIETGDRGDVFVHRSAVRLAGGFEMLKVGDEVEFEVEPDPKNSSRYRAVNVRSV